MAKDFWAAHFIKKLGRLNGKSVGFVCFLAALCHLSSSSPLQDVALCEYPAFHLGPSGWLHWWPNPSSVWNVAMVVAVLRPPGCGCTVTGTGWGFFVLPPCCSAALWFCATAMWGCTMSADLLTQSLHYCVQRLRWEHSIFTPLPYAWVGWGGTARWREGERRGGRGRDDDVDWCWKMRHWTKVT